MAFKVTKNGHVVRASLPRKLPKFIIEKVEEGNEKASAFAKKAQMILSNAKVVYEL
jgi:hypothetical protein